MKADAACISERHPKPQRFVVTMELVPGREPAGRSVDTIMAMAADAFADGRVSAVSITDNPGGNPALSPDVIGHDIFKLGMDVIVHFTCRDANRIGMESRALQLALMGMKNILALTGDYIGKGVAGQGAPVFDLDSVTLLIMLQLLGKRVQQAGDPDVFLRAAPCRRLKAVGERLSPSMPNSAGRWPPAHASPLLSWATMPAGSKNCWRSSAGSG